MQAPLETLSSLRSLVEAFAARIGADASTLPTYGRTEDGARPHVEVREGGYHYVVVERGMELLRRSTPDLHALLYWIFRDVTHQMAFDHELAHRVAGRDGRRIAFPRQVALLAQVDPAMAQQRRAEIEALLAEHPFDDEAVGGAGS